MGYQAAGQLRGQGLRHPGQLHLADQIPTLGVLLELATGDLSQGVFGQTGADGKHIIGVQGADDPGNVARTGVASDFKGVRNLCANGLAQSTHDGITHGVRSRVG